MSTLSSAINASASALDAQRTRMEVAVSNMANAESTRSANGQPYRRREVVLESQSPFEAGFSQHVTQAAGTGGGGRDAGCGDGLTVTGRTDRGIRSFPRLNGR